MNEAEQIIKNALDGWFFTFNIEKQQTRAQRVAKDHIPTHRPRAPICLDAPGYGAKVWKPEEDELLFEMFNKGYSFRDMAKALDISQALANNRFRQLCLKRGIEPKRRNICLKFTEAEERRLVELRERGLTFKEIAKVMGKTVNQIAGVWLRYRRSIDDAEEAA